MAEDSKAIPVARIFLDIAVLLTVGLPILFLFLFGSAFQRGFYCDDESLRHPYHDSTVPSYLLYIFGLGLNISAMGILELRRSENGATVRMGKWNVPSWFWEFYKSVVIFCFGALCSQLITDSMKYSVGRLRPHFYTICGPVFDNGKTCESIGPNYHRYITDFTCSKSLSKRKLKEMRLSFPSGHSSFSMYTMVYFAIYLHSRMKISNYRLVKHFLQYSAILAALLTGMSRISDYKHHWSDVLAGLCIGTISAVVTSKCVSNLFGGGVRRVAKGEPNFNNGRNAPV